MKYMAISQEDRKSFEQVLETLKGKPEETGVVLKVLFTFLQKTTPFKVELQSDVRNILEQHVYNQNHTDVFKELKKCWSIVASVAQEEEVGRSYSTGQLARFFGVSITTVNKWIATGRLVGIERSARNKQARISENTIWISPTGEQIPVREVVERYIQIQDVKTSQMDEQEYKIERVKEIVKIINFFEERYGGTYQKVVEQKGDPYLTDDWQWGREGKEWHYLLKEIGDL
ncbi:hypothetical protein [Ferviditalea candida]|uniref:Helix-turn-helix domain-containing protein n=1 Tax=Ferviditalea candida TaxID=3108399 RepID=A0ABU5ZNA3_9BACL|nr:hypothetical protein [Paenibacillaceae bacterium T2]